MSRVDDSDSDRRAEEARLADRRAQERLKKQRSTETTAFDRALAQRSSEQTSAKAFKESLEPAKAPLSREAREVRGKDAATQSTSTGERAEESSAVEQGQTERTGAEQQTDRRVGQRAGQASAGQSSSKADKAQTRASKEAQESHVSESGPDSKGEDIGRDVAGVGVGKKGGPVKRASDQDSGGSGQDQGGSQTKDQKPASFKVPLVALMAPPPLARPKDAGAARLSSMTKEIVDKIVSRVMVGHNSAGAAEFRIELKSSVLKGLSIKVSGGRGGKIRAVFSGSDRETLAALKKSSSELVDALSARGLTLEDLQFEER